MGCISCQKRSRRIGGLNLFKQKLQAKRQTSDQKTVNTNTHNDYEPKVNHSAPVTKPKITPRGWVVSCLICGKEGLPAQLPQLAKANCNCKE